MAENTSRDTRSVHAIIVILALLILGGVSYFIFVSQSVPDTVDDESVVQPYIVPPLGGEQYVNDTLRFRLELPEGFSPREMQGTDGVGATIVLEDAEANGIQIATRPFDEDLRVLSVERVQSDIPDMQIIEPQPVEIGESHTGLAFKSDNEAFSGASREVWFVFNGTLYQISTYERLDNLLKTMFQTWEFF